MCLDLQRLDQLMRLVVTERLAELDVVEDGWRVHIERRVDRATTGPAASDLPDRLLPTAPGADASTTVATGVAAHTVSAAMSGVFCRSLSAGGTPLCAPGNVVGVGAALAIIEAMKIINEVVADVAGTVVEVLCEDGQSVEQGQPLFIIHPDLSPTCSTRS